jgi:hypothetical protein
LKLSVFFDKQHVCIQETDTQIISDLKQNKILVMLRACQEIADQHYKQAKSKLTSYDWKYEDGEAYLRPEVHDRLNQEKQQLYLRELEKAVLELEQQLKETKHILTMTQKVLNFGDHAD